MQASHASRTPAHDSPSMRRILTFDDPHPYERAIRSAAVDIFVKGKGEFHAELVEVDLHRLWLHRRSERLPRLVRASVRGDRAAFGFPNAANQATIRHSGMEVTSAEIIVHGSNAEFYRQSSGPSSFSSLSFPAGDFSAVAGAILGQDIAVSAITHLVRPDPDQLSRLVSLHKVVMDLTEADNETLALPQVTRSLEETILHALANCLSRSARVETSISGRRSLAIMSRLEEYLALHYDDPVYLSEICMATGVSESTLRRCCNEHLGMGPVQYLWRRRMGLAHAALLHADPATSTVTSIATDHGFWELGRFAVQYRKLFGESPASSLRKFSDDTLKDGKNPLAWRRG